tara:strand:- start:738 stop:1022 length:285 start_codon:yes stop_codon:yes gene_type:complete
MSGKGMDDPRFAAVAKDARFKRLPKSKREVKSSLPLQAVYDEETFDLGEGEIFFEHSCIRQSTVVALNVLSFFSSLSLSSLLLGGDWVAILCDF